MSKSGAAYLEEHGVQTALTAAISAVLLEKPSNPLNAIGELLLAARAQPAAAASPLDEEEARKDEKPIVNGERAVSLALELYGLSVVPGTLKDLDSYDDRNFYFKATHSRPELADEADAHGVAGASPAAYHFVLKVHNGVESLSPGFIEAQNAAMDLVRGHGTGVWCPRALPSIEGAPISFAPSELASGVTRSHAIRCLPFKPGGLMGGLVASEALLRDVGVAAANVSIALATFDHPATHRTFIWDLAQTAAVRPLTENLSPDRRPLVAGVLDEFESRVLPTAPKLRVAVIHGDINDQNVLVDKSGSAVAGIIDFGDMCRTWLINEIAISAAYALIALHYEGNATSTAETPPLSEIDTCVAMVSSYAAHMASHGMALSDDEWHVLPTLIACRIAMSLSIGAYSSAKDPTNEYLKLTLIPGLTALAKLRATPADDLLQALKAGYAQATAK